MTKSAAAAATLRPSAALLGAQIAIAAAIERCAVAATGHDPTTLDLLLRIGLSPQRRTRAVDVGRQLQLSAGYVSKRLTRAEAAGLIRREPDDDDGRAQWITLTSAGQRTVEDYLPRLTTVVDTVFHRSLTADEIETLVELLHRVEGASLKLLEGEARP